MSRSRVDMPGFIWSMISRTVTATTRPASRMIFSSLGDLSVIVWSATGFRFMAAQVAPGGCIRARQGDPSARMEYADDTIALEGAPDPGPDDGVPHRPDRQHRLRQEHGRQAVRRARRRVRRRRPA